MNKQEIFDKVVTHLLTQNCKSTKTIDGEEICAYRGDRGLMCAVGCLIPDEIYTHNIEDVRARYIVEKYMPEYMIYQEFLQKLQHVHDNNPPNEWKGVLINLAKIENLQFNYKG